MRNYDLKLTGEMPEGGKINIKPPYRRIFDKDNNVIGGISRNGICDLTGKVIATASGVEENVTEGDKKVKTRIYESEMGQFRSKSGELTLNGEAIGGVNNSWIIPTAVASAVGLAILTSVISILVIRPWVPSSDEPIICISDEGGEWSERIDMLPDQIYPGSEGEKEFVLKNPHDDVMVYTFDVSELYNGEPISGFPIEFRMKRGGEALTEYWFDSNELGQFTFSVPPHTTYECGIEWRWLFESGNDERDTVYGRENGKYSLDIVIRNTATVY